MGKVKFAVLVKDKNISISTDDTGINILKYLALIAVRVISEMSVEDEKTLRKILCDMIMSAPTRENCLPAKNCKFVRVFARKKGTKE